MNLTMKLAETVELMTSDNWVDRIRAEYLQTKIRYENLHRIIVRYEAGTIEFKPNRPLALLKEQAAAMGAYLFALEKGMEIEKIDLWREAHAG